MSLLSSVRYKIESILKIERLCGHTYYAGFLKPGSLVVDLGGNKGNFSRPLAEKYSCRCFVVEPMPALFAKIPKTDLITPFHLAITDKNYRTCFFVNTDREAG